MPILRYLAAWCVISAASLSAEVRAWEGTLPLPAYEEALPDPNPPFDLFATSRFNYPYTLRENLTGRADRCRVARHLPRKRVPEVLRAARTSAATSTPASTRSTDSRCSTPTRRSRRRRSATAARGRHSASSSISRSRTTGSRCRRWSSPYAQHPDGSASATVGGNIDRPYGMQWTVELRLRPGSTVLEQHVTLYNRSDVRHRFYWWSNAGRPGLGRFAHLVPDALGRQPRLHGGGDVAGRFERHRHERGRQPDEGVRCRSSCTAAASPSWASTIRRPIPASCTLADYRELPAKKIWSWGVDADGLEWRNTLSDDNSGYVEVQAGLFRNQETYAFLEPRQTIRFTEILDAGARPRGHCTRQSRGSREPEPA